MKTPSIWKKKTQQDIEARVFGALKENIDYYEKEILGIPASHLDSKVFSQDAHFLKEAPYISTLIHNPNHIGCHTLGKSEKFFSGTQAIERELIEICAVDILHGKKDNYDGYVASGGTEANMQAVWIYRNYFRRELGAKNNEILLLASEDTHYSVHKASNVFALDVQTVPVDFNTRALNADRLDQILKQAKNDGYKYFIVFANMMTTMYGSVDNPDVYTDALIANDCTFKMHVDGAYGGFFYPFSNEDNPLCFKNPHITSVTLDAHKMAQAPYGTGIFLIEKGYMRYANTGEAKYVEGEDFTLIGSRSGANAVAVWMILMKNGPFGWEEKVYILLKRSQWFCEQLDKLNIGYFRQKMSNIITLKAEYVDFEVAREFGLVPDNHDEPKWFKIVVMEHVVRENLNNLIERLIERKPALN